MVSRVVGSIPLVTFIQTTCDLLLLIVLFVSSFWEREKRGEGISCKLKVGGKVDWAVLGFVC